MEKTMSSSSVATSEWSQRLSLRFTFLTSILVTMFVPDVWLEWCETPMGQELWSFQSTTRQQCLIHNSGKIHHDSCYFFDSGCTFLNLFLSIFQFLDEQQQCLNSWCGVSRFIHVSIQLLWRRWRIFDLRRLDWGKRAFVTLATRYRLFLFA